MSKKTFASLFHRAPQVANTSVKGQATETEELHHPLKSAEIETRKSAEIETRFREALASGKITGDIITTDEKGNVVRSTESTNIFDL